MSKGLVSVVIPVYRVEKYVDRCIRSVVNQSYRELEIILVDDGSPDNCPKICDNWAETDCRIKVIHKKNAGLGMARNTGLDCATGKYIYFVDSDDYIALDTIQKCYDLAQRENADIVTFGVCNVSVDGNVENISVPRLDKYVYEGSEVREVFLPRLIAPEAENGAWLSACGSLCRLDVIRTASWHFVSERELISEDVFSFLSLYNSVKKVAVLPEALYYYCVNEESLTHTYRPDRYTKVKYFYDSAKTLCVKLGYSDKVKKSLTQPYISYTTAALKMIMQSDLSKEAKKKECDQILHDLHLHKVISEMSLGPEKLQRKVFLIAIKLKWYRLCRFFVSLKA